MSRAKTNKTKKTSGGVPDYLNYRPSKTDKQVIADIYDATTDMESIKGSTYAEFNDISQKSYIEDAQKRLNAYVPDKDSYDPPKEDWQANVALPSIRNKLKQMLAGFSLSVPDLQVNVTGSLDAQLKPDKGRVASMLIKNSYEVHTNPVIENFWEAWECASTGTVIKYEGYLKTKYKQKFIKSYNTVTGEIDFDEKEVNVDDRCISMAVPIPEFLIDNFYIHDVQDQPQLVWDRKYNKDEFENEFGKYANSKYVNSKGAFEKFNTASTYYNKEKWQGRVKSGQIEVIRYYNKPKDQYRIIANGVLLLDAPLLWSVNGRKKYPFAKSILEPFTTKHFFWGKAFPDIMAGEYDISNTLFNSVMDKEFRSLVKPLLVGQINRDAFELEDEYVTGSTKIYVDDINQVKPMDIEGATQTDLAMIQLVLRGLAESAPEMPDILAGDRPTAREVLIAEEKMKELKSIYSAFLTDLWVQKYKLRLANITANYVFPREVMGTDGKVVSVNRTFTIPNTVLDEKTGRTGILVLEFRNVKKSEAQKIAKEIAIQEEQMKKKGLNYKKKILASDFFDNHEYSINVIAESLHKVSQAKAQAEVKEKIPILAQFFPEMFAVSQEAYFKEVSLAYDDDPDMALQEFAKFEQAKSERRKAEQEKAQFTGEESGGQPQQPQQQPKPQQPQQK